MALAIRVAHITLVDTTVGVIEDAEYAGRVATDIELWKGESCACEDDDKSCEMHGGRAKGFFALMGWDVWTFRKIVLEMR